MTQSERILCDALIRIVQLSHDRDAIEIAQRALDRYGAWHALNLQRSYSNNILRWND